MIITKFRIACNQSYDKAISKYQDVVHYTSESELKGQALLNIGMMHHFGKGMESDLEVA